ncbi:MAG: DNA recombination protein RmuC [Chlamydiota bacterium]
MEWIVFICCFGAAIFWYFFSKKNMQEEMREQFQSLSFDVLQKSQESFLSLAKEVLGHQQAGSEKELEGQKKEIEQLISPLKDLLFRFDAQHREIEQKREGAYGSLQKQIEHLLQSEKDLRSEAANLASALKSPNVRGAWGQLHLRRVVELSGMLHRCDFFEEVHIKTDEGQIYRPDLVVQLPGKREIVVDAKVSLDAYLQATKTTNNEVKQQKLAEHAQQIKRHIKNLHSKAYWKQFKTSPEYVILFLPAEAFFSAALDSDPSILELGMGQNVVIATPTTLIAILKAVAFGWRQDTISQDAQKIAQLGAELYERMLGMNNDWNKVGESLTKSIDAYNKATRSLEKRVLSSARKLGEVSSEKPLVSPPQVDRVATGTSVSPEDRSLTHF